METDLPRCLGFYFTETDQGTSFYRITDESGWTMCTRRAVVVLE